jgi:hypothetical protein
MRGRNVEGGKLQGCGHRSTALERQICPGREIDQETECRGVEIWKTQRMTLEKDNIERN